MIYSYSMMSFSLDSIILRSFIAIAETGTFSEAALRVGRTQSALSLQIKKLETSLGCLLLTRDARKTTLTQQGEVFLSYAKQMTQLESDIFSRLQEPDIEGEIRLGTPEDFATHYLPGVLAAFQKHHPRVQLNVSCDLTMNLLNGFNRGDFDIILVKRDPQSIKGGVRVWREPLVWVAADHWQNQETILSLVLSPKPCIYRARALDALDRAHKAWRLAYTSPSLAGTIAAVKAGLGITILPATMLPSGTSPIRSKLNLPDLADAEIALLKRPHLNKPGEILADHLIHSLEARE
jgi:DNA-binding transcriptional LysR family regulator